MTEPVRPRKPRKALREKAARQPLPVIGWREWVSFPDLRIAQVKAKTDTGARSSSLHAFDVKVVEHDGKKLVRFKVHPLQRDSKKTVTCETELLEYREVRSSNGHLQRRPVIVTTIQILGQSWPIEVTLANRDEMGFRMLLGREAVRNRFLVDAAKSFYGGSPEPTVVRSKKKLKQKKSDK